MLIGFPVAFALAALGLSFGFLAIHPGFFDFNFLQAIPGRIFGSVLSNELLLAISLESQRGRLSRGQFPFNINKLPIDGGSTRWFGAAASS